MQENKILNLYPIDYPFETLVSRATSNPPKLILNPEFQRKYKWDKDGYERSSKFIESCLMRIPLPACYFAEKEDNTHEVIDGLQRITTIKNFFDDCFALEGMTIFKELEGLKFSQLGDFRNELESTTIRCVILRKENPRVLVKEIFARLNQGAVQLSPQEIRHAIFPGSLDKALADLALHPVIQQFGKGEKSTTVKDSLENEEMVLRFFAMQNDLSDYESKQTKYLDSYMEKNQNIDDSQIEELKNQFNSTLQKCINVFGDDAFIDTNKERRRQGLVHYDLLMWSFKDLSDEYLNTHKEMIIFLFQEMCKTEEFSKSLSGGLQQKSTIIKRRELWKKQLAEL